MDGNVWEKKHTHKSHRRENKIKWSEKANKI